MIELFASVFTLDAFECYWNMMEPTVNYAGWHYDAMYRSYCNTTNNIAVINTMGAEHIRDGQITVRKYFPPGFHHIHASDQADNFIKLLQERYSRPIEMCSFYELHMQEYCPPELKPTKL